ncbi:hypothetical protein JH06_0087 [Blastocystis sp. subtype 4]|uniref:hypothetical protein n=1 Tax=Blastocystis sp. subtype 4 TaxID=944170 RepID=UPI000711EC8F|nr:hypothetical protein JH06_0087 [Blastocystis sp. subtype 4]KNB46555.1 hypothetical protein JH06_0087 [Blastocystis sp. subtype 4]|eukprot:XP_014529998.1 hypothetical protein JH06_0087 [Blastocystis sp. subtype 4]
MSDYDSDVEALRERGNTLLKAKDYDGAIRCYSEAMEVDSYNSKLYSNRCTAYLLLENYDKALADATKCVSIDPDWYKGHVQMGSCYMGMKDYQSAIKEYKKALSLSDTKDTIQKLIDKAIEKESQHNIRYKLFGNAVKTMQTIGNLLRVFILILNIVAMLPFPALFKKVTSLYFAVYLSIVLIHVYESYGMPVFRTYYWKRVASDSIVQYMMPLMIFRNTRLIPMVMMLISLSQFASIMIFVRESLEIVKPSLLKRISDAINAAMAKYMPEQNWSQRTPAEKEYFMREIFGLASASLEIWLLPMSLLLLKQGVYGLVGIVMMYQYLLIRVTVSPHVATALRSIDVSLNRLVYHPRCPLFIRNGYLWIREKIVSSYRSSLNV